MPPIILTLLQGLFLLLLYLFVARAVRAVLRDLRTAEPAARPSVPAGRPAPRPRGASGGGVKRRGATPTELVVHTSTDRPRVVKLNGQEVRFGREDSCTVRLDDTYVSEQHARIYPSGQAWVLADMGSTNGTFLNQQKVTQPTELVAGDQIGIGRTVVEVRK